MPAARTFRLLALTLLLVAASAVVPAFAVAALMLDLVILAAFGLDWLRARRAELAAARTLPPMLAQGAAAEIEVAVTHSGRRPLVVRLRESLHPALAESPLRTELVLAPATRTVWSYHLAPRRRGACRGGPLMARVRGPWGLAWSQRTLVPGEVWKIFPQVRWEGAVGRLLVLAHRRALGQHPRRLRGFGTEPYALREYLPGDPLHKVHWKASARHGRLVSREDTWERGARLVILLDCGRSMAGTSGTRGKLDHALAAALALSRVAASRGDRVAIVAFADRPLKTVRLHGARGVHAAYAALYDLEARLVEPAFDLAAAQAMALESRRSTVVVFTSVTDLAAAELLRRALLELERRHQPILINLEDPELAALARSAPDTPADAFAKTAALDIALANRALGQQLRHAGVRAVTTPADRLALTALESYLAMFGRRAA